MYSIYADNVCIYNDVLPDSKLRLVDPKLILSDNAAGSLSMTVPPTNIGYEMIVRLVTDISVRRDGEEIWAGRVLDEDKDFWNNRVLLCEGELAFFNDSTQPPNKYQARLLRTFLEKLIEVHNSKVAENRQFTLGVVTVSRSYDGSSYKYTNYEKTMTYINDLVDQYGGHLRVRHVDGVRYLDYLKDYPNTNSQTIEFGKNLLDFTRSWDSTEFATVILPLGNQLDESEIEELDAYLTVETVNNGSIYVQSTDAVAEYGWIEKVVHWDDASSAATLMTNAKSYLEDIQFNDMTIELSALDLHYLNTDVESINLLDEIRVISKPHGMDRLFPVTKLEIPLDEPENTRFTLGDTIQTTLTSVNNQTNSDILKKIENLPKESSILKEAKENATALLNMKTNGYITITSDENGTSELYVTDTQDYENATKMWKWNLNGLGYSSDGGKTFGLAITMDGAIVADYITAGTMHGDRITAGTLSVDAFSESVTNTYYTKDQTNDAITNTKSLANYYTKTETDGKFTVSETNITASVTKTITTKLDDEYYTKSQTESLISQAAGEISLKVSNIEEETLRNYCANGDFSEGDNYFDNWYRNSTYVSHTTYGSKSCAKIQVGYLVRQTIDIPEAGSFKVRFKAAYSSSAAASTASIRVRFATDDIDKYVTAGQLTTSWQTFEFDSLNISEGSQYFYLSVSNTNSSYDTTAAYITDVEVLGPGKSWAESEIKLLTNEISLRVTEDDVEAKLALSIEDGVAKLSAYADQISLESGQLIITSGQLTLDSDGNAAFSGTLSASGSVSSIAADESCSMRLHSGFLLGYYGNSLAGYIETNHTLNGSAAMRIGSSGGIVFATKNIVVYDGYKGPTYDISGAKTGKSAEITFVTKSGTSTTNVDLTFVNGLLVE